MGKIREHASMGRAAAIEGVDQGGLSVGLTKASIYRHPSDVLFSKDIAELVNKTSYTRQEIIKYGRPVVVYKSNNIEVTYPSIKYIGEHGIIGMSRPTIAKRLSEFGSDIRNNIALKFDIAGIKYSIGPDAAVKASLGTGVAPRIPLRTYNVNTGEELSHASIEEASRTLSIPTTVIQGGIRNNGRNLFGGKYRISRDPVVRLSGPLTIGDLYRNGRPSLIGSTGAVLIPPTTHGDYALQCRNFGYGNIQGITSNKTKHRNKMRSMGLEILYYIDDVPYQIGDNDEIIRI